MTEPIDPVASDETEGATAQAAFKSELADGRQRFLSYVIVHGLDTGRRTPEDFLRHFGPTPIMEGLAEAPELRAKILTPTTGTKTKVAQRKSWQNAAEDLRIALEVGATNAPEILSAFAPDDRVRYLDTKRLWAYIAEGDFWKAQAGAAQSVARAHLVFMLRQALKDYLLTHREIVEGVTVGEIANRLPRAELGQIIENALDRGHRSLSYNERNLMDDVPPERLVEQVPLPHIWQGVIRQRIADVHGFSGAENAESPAEPAPEPRAGENGERGWSAPPPETRRGSKRNTRRPRGSG
jgi:hypothetical protein